MSPRRFRQVDVFSAEPCLGNALAVVLDGEGLTEQQMRRFASWTNLAETTFLLPPSDLATADYRVRIFTTGSELPFAGHPTLGSCHAWLEAGGKPRADGEVIQECGAGLIRIRMAGGLVFAAPPLRMGEVEESMIQRFASSLGIPRQDIQAASWLVNGPNWVGFLLRDAEQVLSLHPKYEDLKGFDFGVVGPYTESSNECAFEVRAFAFAEGPIEDPVTGSLQAGLGEWLTGLGVAPDTYVSSQGTVLGRAGRVTVSKVDGKIWVGGDCRTLIAGTVEI